MMNIVCNTTHKNAKSVNIEYDCINVEVEHCIPFHFLK